jgi:hypothetical protein
LNTKAYHFFFEFVLNLYLSNLRSDRAWGLSFFKYKVMNFFSFHLEVMNYLSPSFLFSLKLWTIFFLLFFFVGSYELSTSFLFRMKLWTYLSPSFLFRMKLWTFSFFSCSYEVMNLSLLILIQNPWHANIVTQIICLGKKKFRIKKRYHFYWYKFFFFTL